MEREFKLSNGESYRIQHEWPNCRLQGNDYGLVFDEHDIEETAFFEAFPDNTFIRGEGKTVEDAESQAWNKYQRILKCKKHEYKRHSDDGHGICINCGVFHTDVLPCIKKCTVCNQSGVGFHSERGSLCHEHFMEMTEDYTKISVSDFNPNDSSMFSKRDYASIGLTKRYEYEVLRELNLIPEGLDDYDLHKFIKDYFKLLSSFKKNYIFFSVNDNGYKLKILESIALSRYLPFKQSLFKSLLKEFIKFKETLREEDPKILYSRNDLKNEIFQMYKKRYIERITT